MLCYVVLCCAMLCYSMLCYVVLSYENGTEQCHEFERVKQKDDETIPEKLAQRTTELPKIILK